MADMHAMVGASAAYERLVVEIEQAARTDAKVLVTGETGVGKDVAVREIHARSARGNRPFVAINCAGIPDSLLESELFGHVRGSYTDAVSDRAGLLETAGGGTVFLDEVGEMSPRMQGLLLRFLETGEIHRIGDDRHVTRVDLRVIAATNRSLPERVRENAFRADLYYRLNVIQIHIPPLRERKDDLAPLCQLFLRLYARSYGGPVPIMTSDAWAVLYAYDWPGNVRQLKNLMERLVVRGHDVITPATLPAEVTRRRVELTPETAPGTASRTRLLEGIYHHIVSGTETFWTAFHKPFMAHRFTVDDLRWLVARGLQQCDESYPALAQMFGVSELEYGVFMRFLTKYKCHAPAALMAPVVVPHGPSRQHAGLGAGG